MMYRCKICSEHYLSTEALQDHQFASHTQEALEAFGITKQTVKVSQDWQTHSNESKAEILHSLGYTPSDIQTLISLEFYQFGSKVKKEIGEVLNKSTPVKQRAQAVESDENKTYQNMYDSYLQARSAQIKKPFQDGATESKAREGTSAQNMQELRDYINDYNMRNNTNFTAGIDGGNVGYAFFDKDQTSDMYGKKVTARTKDQLIQKMESGAIAESKASEVEDICPICKGTGESDIDDSGIKTGLWIYKCPRCDGTGKIDAQGGFINEAKASEEASEDCPKCGHVKGSHSSPASGDTICYGSSDCTCAMTFPTEGESKASEKEELLSDIIAKINKKYGGDEEQEEEGESKSSEIGYNPSTGVTTSIHGGTWDTDEEEAIARAELNPTNKCGMCNKTFDSVQELKDHLRASGVHYPTGESKASEAISEDEKDEIFQYLFDLQESGATNMFGSGAYVERVFPHLDKKVIDDVIQEWMSNWDSIAKRMGIESTSVIIGETLKTHTDYHKLINSTLSGETSIECSKCAKKFKGQESLNIHYNDSHADNELKSLVGELNSGEGHWVNSNPFDLTSDAEYVEDEDYEVTPAPKPEPEQKEDGEAMVEDIVHKTESGVDITHPQDEWCELCEKPTTSFEVSDDDYDEEVEDLMEEEGVDEITDFDEEEKKDFFEDVDDIKTTDDEQTEDGEAVGLSNNWDDDEKRMDGGDVPQVEEDPYKDHYIEDARDQMQNDIKSLSNPYDLTTDIEGKPWQKRGESLTEEQELQQARESLAPLNKLDDEKSNVTKAFESGASAEDIYSKVGDTTQDRGSEDDLTDIYNKVDVKLNLEKV